MSNWKYKLASWLIGKELRSGREHFNTGVRLAAKEISDFYYKYEMLSIKDGMNMSSNRYAELMFKIQNLVLKKREK